VPLSTAAAVPVFDSVLVVGGTADQRPATLRREIEDWLKSARLAHLLQCEGAAPRGSLAERLRYLDDFSASVWDFRHRSAKGGSVERSEMDVGAVTGAREQVVLTVAPFLGMVHSRPPLFRSYDYVLTLGGLVQSTAWRTAYTAHLLRTAVRTPRVTALTAFRQLGRHALGGVPDEAMMLAALGTPSRRYEAEMVEDTLRRVFAAPPFRVTRTNHRHGPDHARFRVAESIVAGVRLGVVAAPHPRSTQRADTATTMRFWASQVATVRPGDRILCVTSPLFVPYQHALALNHLALPFGAVVDTVGVDRDAVPEPPFPQRLRGAHYLQEIRSMIRAYRSLLDRIDAPG
jgi:hypothetical protein